MIHLQRHQWLPIPLAFFRVFWEAQLLQKPQSLQSFMVIKLISAWDFKTYQKTLEVYLLPILAFSSCLLLRAQKPLLRSHVALAGFILLCRFAVEISLPKKIILM